MNAPFVRPNSKEAISFFRVFFRDGDCLHFRAVPEPRDGRTPTNHHYIMDNTFDRTIEQFLDYCFVESRAAFFLPGPVKNGGTGKADVLSAIIVIDFDKGNPQANLTGVENLLGPATTVVESGGSTEHGPKLHAYYKTSAPATDANIARVCAIREHLAKTYGGDPAFKQPAQVIRIPGSIHFKGTPKLVRLNHTLSVTYALDEIERALGIVPNNANVVDFFDFSRDNGSLDVDSLRDMDVSTEGKSEVTRWDWFNSVAGAEIADIRAGRKTEQDALSYLRGKVLAHFERPEDWTEGRIEREFAALLRVDRSKHGPIIAPIVAAAASNDLDFTAWSIDRFSTPAPARKWLVEGLIPQATAGIFAAPGDAGKSMLALWLAYVVGCYPPTTHGALDVSVPSFFGQPVTRRGAAVILTAEDDADEVHRRIEKLDTAGLRNKGKQRVFVVPMPSAGGVRAILESTPAGPRPTQFWQQLNAWLATIDDLALVVIDPLAAFVDADVDKSNRDGAALMMMLSEFATRSGATVMLTHHVTKGDAPGGLAEGRDGIRGGGALVNNGRWALRLWEGDESNVAKTLKALGQLDRVKQSGVVYLGGLVKGNAPGAKELRTMVRNQKTGLLEDVTDAVRAATPRQDEVDTAVHAVLLNRRRQDMYFNFGISKNTLAKDWGGVLAAAGLDVPQNQYVAIATRLVAGGKLVPTKTKRSGHMVYEPVPR